jgi:hypothetical protein
MELLQACMRNWPDLAERIKSAYDTLPARTKEHLKRRRLEGRDQWGPAKPGRDSASLRLRKEKFERLTEYRAVASELGYNPTAGELANTNSGLIKRIKKSWGSFRTFCAEHGIVPRFKMNTRLRPPCKQTKISLNTDCESRLQSKNYMRPDVIAFVSTESSRNNTVSRPRAAKCI